jgi:hypothetical protein
MNFHLTKGSVKFIIQIMEKKEEIYVDSEGRILLGIAHAGEFSVNHTYMKGLFATHDLKSSYEIHMKKNQKN